MALSEDVVRVENVSKSYGAFNAVKSASFSLTRGECFGLLGPNGAGKSSIIRMLYGAASRDTGKISILGMDPNKQGREIRKRVGVVTQEDALDEQMSVNENMLIYAGFLGLSAKLANERVADLLDFMSLTAKKNATIRSLSGGMRRRLVFVRALLCKPEILILDEPTTGLDPAVRQLLWNKIRELKSQGTTVILTTHYMDEAEVLCERLVIMDRGSIQISGEPSSLIKQHCSGYVAIWKRDDHARVEAASLTELSNKLAAHASQPDSIRPSNLEDVFLKITGKELSGEA